MVALAVSVWQTRTAVILGPSGVLLFLAVVITPSAPAGSGLDGVCLGVWLRSTISDDCCSGFCRDTGAGPVCVPPDEVECSERGEACGSDSDCCEGAGTCIANVCSDLG